MATYADRFAVALASLLPDDVTVTNAQGLVVIDRGNARAVLWPPSGDRRRAVDMRDARDALAAAASRLQREIPHYSETFKVPARELAEILADSSKGA